MLEAAVEPKGVIVTRRLPSPVGAEAELPQPGRRGSNEVFAIRTVSSLPVQTGSRRDETGEERY